MHKAQSLITQRLLLFLLFLVCIFNLLFFSFFFFHSLPLSLFNLLSVSFYFWKLKQFRDICAPDNICFLNEQKKRKQTRVQILNVKPNEQLSRMWWWLTGFRVCAHCACEWCERCLLYSELFDIRCDTNRNRKIYTQWQRRDEERPKICSILFRFKNAIKCHTAQRSFWCI